MANIFNLSNFKDRTYVLILSVIILSFVSIQSILVPSLDYFALKAKINGSIFYNYATVASLAATIPRMSSILISYIINNLEYRYLIKIIIGLVMCLSVTTLFINHSFVNYAVWIILCGVLFNALILGLDRQIYTLLSTKIQDFQSDITLFLALEGFIGYKISYLLYEHCGTRGIIWLFIILNILIYFCLRMIPAIDITVSNITCKSSLPKINVVFKIILGHCQLINFLIIMLAIIFCNSGLILMFNAIIRNNHFEIALFSNIMSIISISGFAGALACRSIIIQRINGLLLLCWSTGAIAGCLILLGLIHVEVLLLIIVGLIGFVNAFFLINMNIKLSQYVIDSKDLIAISPLINGFMTTCFYIVSFFGPLLFNQLLQYHIDYSNILKSCGFIQLLLMILLFYFIKSKSEV